MNRNFWGWVAWIAISSASGVTTGILAYNATKNVTVSAATGAVATIALLLARMMEDKK